MTIRVDDHDDIRVLYFNQIVEFQRLHPDAVSPIQAYDEDAGWDLASCERIFIPPGGRKEVPTGWAIAIPQGFYGRVTGRSSTIRRHGLFVYEGVADSGFRGEWSMHVENRLDYGTVVNAGQYIGQLIVSPYTKVIWQEVDKLTPTERGQRGYGSSG